MPDTLSSFIGQGAPAKKKLKRRGDYYVDEQGNQFLDAEGTQPVDKATQAQTAGEFGKMLKDNPGRTGSLMTGELNPPDRPSIMGGTGNPDLPVPKGMSQEEQARADEVYATAPQQFGSPGNFYRDWMKMDQETRDRMLARARKKNQAGA